MEGTKNEEKNANEVKTKKKNLRKTIVIVVLLLFAVYTAISLRSQYLHTIEIGQEYEKVFFEKERNYYTILGISVVAIYIYIYVINRFIKRGLKKFFEDEKKEMPKLPNKSLAFIISIIG